MVEFFERSDEELEFRVATHNENSTRDAVERTVEFFERSDEELEFRTGGFREDRKQEI